MVFTKGFAADREFDIKQFLSFRVLRERDQGSGEQQRTGHGSLVFLPERVAVDFDGLPVNGDGSLIFLENVEVARQVTRERRNIWVSVADGSPRTTSRPFGSTVRIRRTSVVYSD